MVATNTQHATAAAARAVSDTPELDPQGRQIMRMHSRPGQQRKTSTPNEVIENLWKNTNDKMRADWLQLYAAILSSSTDATAQELATLADEAYFEFHARCNPSKFDTHS